MAGNHTSGPWFINGHDLVECSESAIAGVLTVNPADARLIAAAPDLLAVLEALRDRGHTDATWSLAKKAIAKARGQ